MECNCECFWKNLESSGISYFIESHMFVEKKPSERNIDPWIHVGNFILSKFFLLQVYYHSEGSGMAWSLLRKENII